MDWKSNPLPVLPYLLPDLAVPSLLGLAPRERVRVTAKVPEVNPPDIGEFTTYHSYLSVGTALEMGFAGLISITSKTDSVIALRDTQLVISSVDRTLEDSDTIIAREYYGIALRTAVSAWNFKGTANLNFEQLVANCTLNVSQSAMQMQCVGLGAELLPTVATSLGTASNGLTAPAYQSIVKIEEAFWEYLVANYQRIIPVLLAVDLKPGFLNTVNVNEPSANYALFGIMKRRTCNQILPGGNNYPRNFPYTIDPKVVADIYAAIVGPNRDLVPTADNQARAKRAVFDFDD